ncbi:hypothetical protein fHeYen902_275 [Yersinia phage fHe-Yen9-02]|nr:hypothetical protein fHeYen902_275 [Yersinia phage fHe-Yen9-02]
MVIKPPTMKEINALEKPWRGMSFFAGCGGSSTGHKMSGVNILIANEFVDSARLSYEANHPTTKMLPQDIRRLDPAKILKYLGLKKGELDLLDGSPPCFTEETLIQTRSGMKYINQIVVDDFVLTHKQRYRRVVEPMRRQYTGLMHKIVSSVSENNATPEHPYYIRRMENDVLSEPQWVDARDVRVGDKVAIPTSTHATADLSECSQQIRQWAQHDEFWWLVGQWVANGSMSRCGTHRAIRFRTHSSRGNQLLEQALDLLELTSIQTAYCGGKYIERFVMNEELATFFKLFLTDSAQARQIPGFVLDLPDRSQRQFVFGYQSRCYESTFGKALVVQTRSLPFMTAMRHLVASAFKCPLFSFNTQAAPEELPVSNFTYLPESECGQWVNHQAVFFIQEEDRGFIRDADDLLWVDVLANTQYESSVQVYNFSVSQDETYVATNTVVHNCKGFSSAGVKEEGWGREVKYSEDKVQHVDDLFDEFCRMLSGTMPKVFTAENVSGLVKGVSRGFFIEIMKEFDRIGYKVRAPLMNAAWLGVPQSRERILFMGVRKDIPFDVPDVEVQDTIAILADALPHIAAFKGIRNDMITYIPAINSPCKTITATDSTAYETARFSTAGFIETMEGKRRKLTIEELKVISGMPSDYKLVGTFEQQWERLGRVCVPQMTHAASKALIEHVLIPYAKKRKKKVGDIFR